MVILIFWWCGEGFWYYTVVLISLVWGLFSSNKLLYFSFFRKLVQILGSSIFSLINIGLLLLSMIFIAFVLWHSFLVSFMIFCPVKSFFFLLTDCKFVLDCMLLPHYILVYVAFSFFLLLKIHLYGKILLMFHLELLLLRIF